MGPVQEIWSIMVGEVHVVVTSTSGSRKAYGVTYSHLSS